MARDLGILFEEIKRARFTDCEIEATINSRHPVKEILRMVVAYSNLKRNDQLIHAGTLYFNSADKDLKLCQRYRNCSQITVANTGKTQDCFFSAAGLRKSYASDRIYSQISAVF